MLVCEVARRGRSEGLRQLALLAATRSGPGGEDVIAGCVRALRLREIYAESVGWLDGELGRLATTAEADDELFRYWAATSEVSELRDTLVCWTLRRDSGGGHGSPMNMHGSGSPIRTDDVRELADEGR